MERFHERNIINSLIFIIVLQALVGAGNTKLFELGSGHVYQLTSIVLLNEPGDKLKGKDVGSQMQADVSVAVPWQNLQDKNEKLLEIQLIKPKLLVQSKKEKQPHMFESHKSQLDTAKNYPFLVHWKNGLVLNLFIDEREDSSIMNLKKGIVSLFQFQVLDMDANETDVSGNCSVSYKSIDPFSFIKTKTNCFALNENKKRKSSKFALSANVTSSRVSTYKLSRDLSVLESINAVDNHNFIMPIRKEAGGSVVATQHLVLNGKTIQVKILKSSSLENAVDEYKKLKKLKLKPQDIELQAFSPNCDKEDCLSLPMLLKENRDHLSDSSLGTSQSAFAFVKLLSAARKSSKSDLTKAFKGSKNKEILTQLCDLAGAIQSSESHEIIMKLINFEAENDFDKSERYLWALATGSYPNEIVIRDIFRLSQINRANEKLDETLLLVTASMAHRLSQTSGNENIPLVKEIAEHIAKQLSRCEEEYCKIKHLRALKNLRKPEFISHCVQHALNGKTKSGVEAMKCLKSYEPVYWTEEVIDVAQRVYFQVGRRYDSSSRTLALDILLESSPSEEILKDLLLTLTDRDREYEVKQYLVQRVKQISEKNENFSKLVALVRKELSHRLSNYNVAAQRGLTTAFARNFITDEYRNGSLSTVLEISKGLLKRGIVDVVIENSEESTSLFSLGLFAGGLSSFVSSEGEDEGDEDDIATAGMELTVLGSQIRPFTFFSGQGELMGHVWSGTASEKTPAYEAIILVVDFSDEIPLQNGFLLKLDVLGAVSLDLSGQIQISLWNKNAHSLVEKDAGISLQGHMRVDSSFVRSKVEFNVATEVKLNLQSDLNFYGGNTLCMQLSQPEVTIRHNIHKYEKISGEKYRVKRSKYYKRKIPGRSYVLNKKNDEMCNSIFS